MAAAVLPGMATSLMAMATPEAAPASFAEQLRSLAELKAKGIPTDEEFATAKAKVLSEAELLPWALNPQTNVLLSCKFGCHKAVDSSLEQFITGLKRKAFILISTTTIKFSCLRAQKQLKNVVARAQRCPDIPAALTMAAFGPARSLADRPASRLAGAWRAMLWFSCGSSLWL